MMLWPNNKSGRRRFIWLSTIFVPSWFVPEPMKLFVRFGAGWVETIGIPAHIDVRQAESHGRAEEEVRQPHYPALGDHHQTQGRRPLHSAGGWNFGIEKRHRSTVHS